MLYCAFLCTKKAVHSDWNKNWLSDHFHHSSFKLIWIEFIHDRVEGTWSFLCRCCSFFSLGDLLSPLKSLGVIGGFRIVRRSAQHPFVLIIANVTLLGFPIHGILGKCIITQFELVWREVNTLALNKWKTRHASVLAGLEFAFLFTWRLNLF